MVFTSFNIFFYKLVTHDSHGQDLNFFSSLVEFEVVLIFDDF